MLIESIYSNYSLKTLTIKEIGIPEKMNPVELLVYLLKENNLNKSELARQLNVSRQLITEIINYKRNISKHMVICLQLSQTKEILKSYMYVLKIIALD